MRRILIILGLFFLLMPARHGSFDGRPVGVEPMTVTARPMTIPLTAADLRQLGGMRFAGAWELTSSHERFGGISSIIDRGDGGVIAVSDRGEAFMIDPRRTIDKSALIAGLPTWVGDGELAGWQMDSEAVQTDPVSGRSWISFEMLMRFCRYAPALRKVESCYAPPAMSKWEETEGAEAFVRFADGRFLAFSETHPAPGGALEALLFSSDPSDPEVAPPAVLSYLPPTGYRPTDAVDLGQGRVLVLNRRVTVANGFSAILAIVDVRNMRSGGLLVAHPVARFSPPIPSDNFEAIALTWEKGRPALWLASDDNHFFFQRSLLYKLLIPQDWINPRP